MTATKTNKQIRTILEDNFSQVSMRNGEWTVRVGFYYTHGGMSDKVVERVRLALISICEIDVIDHGEVWKPFRGGASVANQSHWFVKFRVN